MAPFVRRRAGIELEADTLRDMRSVTKSIFG
jgi:hypothetical protein